MKRRLTQNWGVTSAREVARIKLEGRRWITGVGGILHAGPYALMRADRCARDRKPRLRQQRARARGLGTHLSCL